MDENEFFSQLLILPGLLIVGGFAVMVATILRGAKVAEFQHRERMAMIERGQTPPESAVRGDGPDRAHGFKMTLGIMLCGFGLALTLLIAFSAGNPGTATGVGGAFVMLGLAFITSALVSRKDRDERPRWPSRSTDESERVPPMPPAPPPSGQ